MDMLPVGWRPSGLLGMGAGRGKPDWALLGRREICFCTYFRVGLAVGLPAR